MPSKDAGRAFSSTGSGGAFGLLEEKGMRKGGMAARATAAVLGKCVMAKIYGMEHMQRRNNYDEER